MSNLLPVNRYSFQSVFGEKCFELHCGDILETEIPYDVLVLSAFKGDYYPTKTSLIGGIYRKYGISVEKLAENPMIDLRDSMNVWVSKSMPEALRFKYIICIEMVDIYHFQNSFKNLGENIHNLFTVIEMLSKLDSSLHSVIMPVIGTGNQGIAHEKVLDSIFTYGSAALTNCKGIKNIYLLERKPYKVRDVSSAMDQVLGREECENTNLKRDAECSDLILRIADLLETIVILDESLKEKQAVIDLSNLLYADTCTYSFFAVAARKWLELIVNRATDSNDHALDLNRKIGILSHQKVFDSRSISYMHLIRSFGNDNAHSGSEAAAVQNENGGICVKSKVGVFDQRSLLYAVHQVSKIFKEFLISQKN